MEQRHMQEKSRGAARPDVDARARAIQEQIIHIPRPAQPGARPGQPTGVFAQRAQGGYPPRQGQPSRPGQPTGVFAQRQQGGYPPRPGQGGPRPQGQGGFAPRQPRFQRSSAPRGRVQQAPKDPSTMSFEDKLKAFMSDSESRQADVRHATDRKNGSRRRR